MRKNSSSEGRNLDEKNTEPVSHGTLLTAEAAAAMLNVKPATIYSYVSRNLIHAAPRSGSEKSLYYRKDIDALLLRSRSRVFNGAAAEHAIRWGGGEVLRSSITSLSPEGPCYRGKLAADLVREGRPFEDCAMLLCGGELVSKSVCWSPVSVSAEFDAFSAPLTQAAKPHNWRRLFAMLVHIYSMCDDESDVWTEDSPSVAARRLLPVLAPGFGLLANPPRYRLSDKPEWIAAIIARSVGVPASHEVLRAIDAALILGADHELAPSTFAARIAASADSSIYSCVVSALGAVEGVACDRAEQLLHSVDSPAGYIENLREHARRAEAVPGYNHPLYPQGDPRGLILLDLARKMERKANGSSTMLSCIDTALDKLGLVPGVSIGLVAIAATVGLPRFASGALMALARTVGWIAHAAEQRAAGFLVRPRARYVTPG